ncbi:MAG: biotin transporter BioY [Lachnospiraceae bacterium]|nr:biotin transporter BioY [Lachnospiraceae bacterium]
MKKSRDKLEIKESEKSQKTKNKKNRGDTIVELTKAALFAAVFCVLSPHTLYLPFGPVGITLGSFLLYLTGLLLGPRLGIISVFLYLCLGLLGLPVFAGYTAGAGVLFGPTGGFLLGYVPCVAIIGFIIKNATGGKKGIVRFLLAMLAGTLVLYLFGTVWFMGVYTKGASFFEALSACVLPFLPFDGAKLILAAALYRPFLPLKYRTTVTNQ